MWKSKQFFRPITLFFIYILVVHGKNDISFINAHLHSNQWPKVNSSLMKV